MIVDSGAKVSYINNNFVSGMESEDFACDYSPYIGNFQTPLYNCKTELLIHNIFYKQKYGTPPPKVATILNLNNMDGIIGIDLFKLFRIQINGNKMYLPPQGI